MAKAVDGGVMIELCRINHTPLIVNALHIISVEETPDTLVTLSNGDKLLVREPASEVVRLATLYYKGIGGGNLTVVPTPERSRSWT